MQPQRQQSLTSDGEGLARLLERAPHCPARLPRPQVVGRVPRSNCYSRLLRWERGTVKCVSVSSVQQVRKNPGGNDRHGAVATPAHRRRWRYHHPTRDQISSRALHKF